MTILADKEIETQVTPGFYAAKSAALDVAMRSAQARDIHEDFFSDPEHIRRVDETKQIVKDFFKGATVYVNQRGLGRSPFTVIKVERPLFPNHLSFQDKQDLFYQPLRALDVEIVFAKGSDSYLFRIR